MHFQRVATFVSPDGQETTKCLWLAKDMLPGQGRTERLGRFFYLPTQADLWSPTEKKCLGVMVWRVLISQLM